MAADDSDDGLLGFVRRAAGGAREVADSAFDATVGRVGHTAGELALEATNSTAQQVIEDLEPYLIAEAIPRIVAGITPYLTDEVVPEVLAGITDQLTTVTVPDVVDGVTDHLTAVTVPAVVSGVTPRLVDDLLPHILAELQPYLEQQLVPQIVDGLMPKIQDQVAPELLEALMPRIENEVAPQLVDALMPKIRREVVPQILDDIVDDPRIRDLIREQSQGLFLDTLEGFRGKLADADNTVDSVGRKILRRPKRPRTDTALEIVLADVPSDETKPLRLAIDDLAEQRSKWRSLPTPPAPAGRDYTYAGAASRLLGLGIDLAVVGYLTTVLFSTLGGLVDSLFDGNPPEWLTYTLVALAASAIPTYLALCYWILGRTLGMGIVGVRICTPDGRRPGLVRSVVRAWALVVGLVFWVVTGVTSFFDSKRRSLLDLITHTEVRYSVPESQQRRHVRDAVEEQHKATAAAA